MAIVVIWRATRRGVLRRLLSESVGEGRDGIFRERVSNIRRVQSQGAISFIYTIN